MYIMPKCGCDTVSNSSGAVVGIVFCPLHKAAAEMLTLAVKVLQLKTHGRYRERPHAPLSNAGVEHRCLVELVDAAEAAIAHARPELSAKPAQAKEVKA